jgi:hypothetical protein
LSAGAIKCRLGAFTLRFQSCGAFAQNVVELDNAVFDRAVEPAESLVGVGYLALQ